MNILFIIQIIVSILLVLLVLLQAKGVGLSATFGGEGGFYRTKRGFEKLVFILTIVFGIIFVAVSLISLTAS